MAALVQSYPQPSGSVTLLQARNSSATTMLSAQSSQPVSQYINRGSLYRPNTAPIKPYAFTSTPSLNRVAQADGQQHDVPRTALLPTSRQLASWDSSYNPTIGLWTSGSRDDSSILPPRPAVQTSRPQSAYMTRSSSPQPPTPPIRNTPDRYRRPTPMGPVPAPPPATGQLSSSELATAEQLVIPRADCDVDARKPAPSHFVPGLSGHRTVVGVAVDDIQLRGPASPQLENKRLRRRSMHTLDSADYPEPLTPQLSTLNPASFDSTTLAQADKVCTIPPRHAPIKSLLKDDANAEVSKHLRAASTESAISSGSNHSRQSSTVSPAFCHAIVLIKLSFSH